MKCVKRDIVKVSPARSNGNFVINLEQLEEICLSYTIKDEKGVGRYIPCCDFPGHRGVIVNGLFYICKKRECFYFRRYLESGNGTQRVFSTEGDQTKVKPYSHHRRIKNKLFGS